jgi:trimethylamine--corrinoid protein Co-methyltransferase
MSKAAAAVLSSDEVDAIDAATYRLLETVGVLVREPRALRLLLDAGATLAVKPDRVVIPAHLLKEALRRVPKQWTWFGRDRRHDLRVGEGGRTRLGPGSACSNFLDYSTGKCRPPAAKDGIDLVRLMDALELVDINFTPVDDEADGLPARFHQTDTLIRDLTYTTKPLVGPSYDGTMAKDGLEVVAVLAGGKEELRRRPMLAGYCDPVSPLVHDRTMTETLVEYAALGQPVFIMALDLAGASAPATLAGTLLLQNAEVLSGILIAHLVNPDAPVIYGSVSGIMDMRAGTASVGGPEFALVSAASAQLAHHYGIPCSVGGQSDSKMHDAQASMEKMMTLLSAVTAGADFVDLFFGSFEGFNTTSLEQVVIDHDIAGFVFRYRDGITVDEATLGLDLIREVGPGGNYLRNRSALRHTRQWMLREDYLPSVADRRSRFAWEKAGSSSLLERAHARVTQLLSEHQDPAIDPGALREMKVILERIRKDCLSGESAT